MERKTLNRQKVLFFIKLPPPLSGATLMNKFVAESKFINQRFEVKIISISYKSKIEDTRLFSLKKIKKILSLYISLFRTLINFKPQLVYFQISPLGWAFYRDCTYIFLIKLFRKHILYHLHGKGIKEVVLNSKLKKKIYTWALKNNSVICLSEHLTSDISDIYFQKPYIVNNAIPVISSFNSLEKKQNNIVRILFLSNLIISKGILVFLDALSLIKEKYYNKIEVSIVGGETELSRLEINSEIEQRGINHFVKYIGPKYGEDKNNIYRETNLLIYPTLNDVWGLVILEAMQAGIPIIATKEGAIPEIIDNGITGFLVDKNNPEQIAEKLEILINDTELRQKMGQAGHVKFLEKYSLDIFEKNMVTVFNNILKNVQEK